MVNPCILHAPVFASVRECHLNSSTSANAIMLHQCCTAHAIMLYSIGAQRRWLKRGKCNNGGVAVRPTRHQTPRRRCSWFPQSGAQRPTRAG
jgi:hypothetical protein